MQTTKKKTLALFLSLIMILSLFSGITVFGAEEAPAAAYYVQAVGLEAGESYLIVAKAGEEYYALTSTEKVFSATPVTVDGKVAAAAEENANLIWTYTDSNYLQNVGSTRYIYFDDTGRVTAGGGKAMTFENGRLGDGMYYLTFADGAFGMSDAVDDAAEVLLFTDPASNVMGNLADSFASGKYYIVANTDDGYFAIGVSNKLFTASKAYVSDDGFVFGLTEDNLLWTYSDGNLLHDASGRYFYLAADRVTAGGAQAVTYADGHLGGGSYYVSYSDGAFTATDVAADAADILIFEQFTSAAKYTITFDPNAEGLAIQTAIKTEGEPYEITESLYRAGFAFSGWSTEADGSGDTYAKGDQITEDGDLTLYAVWSEVEPATFTRTDDLIAHNEYIVTAEYEGKYYALFFDGSIGAAEVTVEGDTVTNSLLDQRWILSEDMDLESVAIPSTYFYPSSRGMTYSAYGRNLEYDEGILHFSTSSGETGYVLFDSNGFGYLASADSVPENVASIVLFTREVEWTEPEQEVPAPIPAPATIERNAVTNDDGSVTLGFTSDVHHPGGSTLNLQTWLEASEIGYIDGFGFCGDMGSAYLSGDAFWNATQEVMDYMDSLEDAGAVGNAIYTHGNHEWFPSAGGDYGKVYQTNTTAQRLMQVGAGLVTDKYIIYCFGAGEISASQKYDYNVYDAATMAEYLETAPTDRPIFILTHFPLHIWKGTREQRYMKHADPVIDALNAAVDSGHQIIVLWGHNHSDYDDYYYKPVYPGGEITINPSGDKRTLKFTYLAAGCTADAEYTSPSAGSAATMNKGLIATINADGTIDYKYYTIDGEEMNLESPWMVRFRTGIDQYEVFATQYVDDGETIEAIEAPVLNGYDFVGWYCWVGGSEVEFDFDQPITRNTLVTAKYEKIILPVSEAAERDPNYVYVTIQDQQETAIGSSGAPIALYPVPYEEGMTIGDAFIKVHELEFEGGTDGVIVEDSGYGAYYLTKVWGLVPEHGSWIFDPNSTTCYVDANAEAEPGACYYTLAYESAWKSTSFMNPPSVETLIGETITMAAMTFAMDSSYNYSAEGMAGDVYCGTSLDDLELVDTTEDGYFDISFDEAGEYIVVVKGSFGDAMGFVYVKADDPYTYNMTDALVADSDFMVVAEYEGRYYAMSYNGSLGAVEVELDGNTILNSRKELDWVPTEDFQLQSAVAEDIFLFPYSGGMTYSSGRKLIYADGHLSWTTSSGGSGYLTFDGSAFGYSTASAEAAANILLFEKFTGFTLADTLEAGMEYLVVADYEGSYYALSYDGALGAEAVEVEGDVVNTENLALMWLPDGEDHLESKHTRGQFIFAGSGGFMTYEDSMLRVFLYNAETQTVQLHTKYVLTFNGEKFDQSESAADAARILIFSRISRADTEPVVPEDPIPEVYPAPDTIYKDAVKNDDGSITLGFTSDIHYDGKNLNLKTWLEASGIEYIDTFGSCGDMGSAYASNAADFWNWAGAVMDYMDTLEDAGVVGDAVYTHGNHEWMSSAGGDFSNSYYEYDAAKRLKQVGELVVTDDYIVYAFGAGQVAINNTYDYNTHDIDTLREYLATAPADRPIFILTHFPLHRWESRTVKRAQMVVDALNSNPNLNLIVLWGHNHSNYDDYYYLPKFPGDEIVIDTKGTSCEINFTYLAAGCTADVEYTGPSAGSAATMNKGLIATINADGSIDYKYYTIDGMEMNIESPWMVRFRTGIDQYEVFATQYVDDGETVEAIEAPVLNGYDFVGWYYRDGGSEVEFDFDQPITRNILVTAKYDKIVLPVTEAAKRDPGFVYVTIQDQQETAIGTSGAPIALYPVPYTEGMTIGDAFVKVHELEFEGGTDGVIVEDSGYGAYYLTKVWGLVPEHGSWIFDPNSTTCYVDANAEAEPGACYYTLAYESAWKSTSFMNSPSVDTVVGETITMAAMTFAMDSSYNYSAEGMAGDVYCGNSLDNLEQVGTTDDGYFDISFEAIGEYIIVVKGSFGDAMGFVSVKPPVVYRLTDALETDVPAILVTESEGTYYAMSFTEEMGKYAAPAAQEVTISGELITEASDNIVWIPGAGNVLQNKALPEVFIYAGSSGLMTYTSGRAFVYNPETQHVLMHSKYWLIFDGSVFTQSEDEADATAFQIYGASNVNLYTITFDANADGLDGLTCTKTEGEPYEITEALERSGYSFEGWNTKADGSGTAYAVGDTVTEDADLTLYAQWEAEADELVINGLTANKTVATVGETITWSADATGGTGTLRYRFFVYHGSTQVYADSTYSAANTFRYAPTAAGTYRARVFVRDSAGTTVNLMGKNITVEAAVLTPGAISSATASAVAGKITVTWTESEGATAYIIQRRVKDDTTWTTLKSNVTGLSYEDTTGVGGTVYQYRVRGRNGNEYGPFKTLSVVRAIEAAPATTGTIATAAATAAPGKITVTWTESEGATAYIIQRRVKDDTTWTTLKSNVTGLSYEDTTGEAGVVYQYRIRGRDGTVYGPFKVTSVVRAQAGTVIVTPGTIASVTATASVGKITVSWTESEGATAYIIQRRVKDDTTWTTLKSNVTGTSFEDTTGEAGVVYQYRVRGRDGTVYGIFKVSSVVRAK